MKNDVNNFKKFIKIVLVWLLIPALCVFLKETTKYFSDISEGILLYFLILEMIKISRDILRK